MADQKRGYLAASGIPGEHTQQEGDSHIGDLHIGEMGETGRNGDGRNEGRIVSHSHFGVASSDAESAAPSSSGEAARGPAASLGEHFDPGEAHSEANAIDGIRNHIQASTVGEGADKTPKSERQLPLQPGARATRLETDASATNEMKQQGKAGAAAAEEQLDTNHERPSAGDRRASALRDGTSCPTCGTRAEFVACAECGRLFHAACNAELWPVADVYVSGLCRGCRAKGNKGSENTLRQEGVRKSVHEQNVSDEFTEKAQRGLVVGTARRRDTKDGSDVQPAAKAGDGGIASAAKSIEIPQESQQQAHIIVPQENEVGEESQGVDKKKLPQRLNLDGHNKAGEDSSFATSNSASAEEVKADAGSIKAERPTKPPTTDTSSVDSDARAKKSRSTTSEAESGTLVVDGVTPTGQDIKSVEASDTCAEQNSTVAEGDVKSTSDGDKSGADKSTVERSKPLTGSRSDVENSSSGGDKENDKENSRSAEPSIAALDTSKSASESKDGGTITQEGGGSGAEDEEEEEDGELLRGGMSGESEKKEYMASRKRAGGEAVVRGKPTSPRSLSPSPCHYRRKRRRGENGAVATRYKVNVGPRHQVPALPPFFLDSSCTRDERTDRLPETRELYSHDAGDTARLVYSPFAMQRVYRKRLEEGTTGECGIRNADEMNEFIRKVAENWTNKSGWQPFSPEYAYKLLHFAGYDPQRALRIMKDSRFCFTTICDPPQRRYDNKWRPKDRRGQIATHPYPSPLTLRAYLSRRNQHAAATAAAENANSRS